MLDESDILRLQGQAGNAAVVQLLQAPPSAAHRTLRAGDSGLDVTVLQNKLATLGVDPLPSPTDFFDATTKTSLTNFQRQRKLTADGVCGAQTWAAIDSLTAGRTLDETAFADFAADKARADGLRKSGDFIEAEAIYRQIYVNPAVPAPARTGITFSLGTCAQGLGRFEEAIGFYQESLDLPTTDSAFRLDVNQRVRECRLRVPPGQLESAKNEAPLA